MKTFEEIYADTVKQLNCNYGEEFAKAIFNAGREVSLAQHLEATTKDTVLRLKLLSFVMLTFAKLSCDTNAADISLSSTVTIKGKKYFTRLSSVTFEDNNKTLEERAADIADHILASTPICDFKDVLIKAILSGYDLRKEDFEED